MIAASESGGGFRVRPDALEAAGADATALAAALPTELGGVTEAADRTASALPGWAAGPALRTATDAWRTLLTTLAAELGTHGRQLADTARQYRDGDTSAASPFTGLAATRPLPAPPTAPPGPFPPLAPRPGTVGADPFALDPFGTTLHPGAPPPVGGRSEDRVGR
ncbi:hypothetical protein GCM10009665_46130 [Kitasatospora nipponensis]|uniref:Excreted virulence factor EspC (Type VII ESX diderm) n=1 Tax=Kitasatospora nipponensis TaxID=258049 RepID=A0ABP4H9J4_9ACTN